MLPFDFIEQMRPVLGGELDAFLRSLQTERETSVRLNDKVPFEALSVLHDAGMEEVPWCPDGYYLKRRPQFTLDPLMHAGCYYVQEASSMFLDEVLAQFVRPDSIVLDMCGAPGGKATLISQFLNEEGLLITNEVVRQRVFILSENIQKWGNGNAVVTHNQARDFGDKAENLFDCVLVDAPCSGEGLFRKDEGAVDEWSLRNVQMCAERQRDILRYVWPALKPGGILIYSTCTYNPSEDEDNALFIRDTLGADVLKVDIDPAWNITLSARAGYHFYPHKTRGEGFYLCVFRKREAPFTPFRAKAEKTRGSKTVDELGELQSWLQHPERWSIRQSDRFTEAYPTRHKELIDWLSTHFTCVSTGFGIGELRGKHVAPQHSLSMLKDFRKEAFPQVELSLEMALAFLRSEALILPDQPSGYLLMTYQGVPLGFVKNIGNHSNNLYPNEWRIRYK
ncbi:MAG: rRNA cytosine-C5-methyltransferase [Bacteroidales bacterium]|jgi:16S rRNA C967 or C1407 C5-methylase (RsmB/RsmF family)/NOL1/NOP2/fmu family ribosome biogenesis protein|nr:rRNA cytosine-C5-methyltransferase [Bacteroidales bacterium]